MRSPLFLLSAVLLASLLLACNQEAPRIGPTQAAPVATPMSAVSPDPAPSPVIPGPAEAQPVTKGPSGPTEVPVPTLAPPTASVTHTGASGVSSRGAGWSRLVSSTGVHTAPEAHPFGNQGAPNLAPLPLTQPAEGALTVSATGRVTVVPDLAFVVVAPEEDYGPYGPQRFSKREEQEITKVLASIGIDPADITFDSMSRYEPSAISTAVDVNGIEERGAAIVEAVEEVLERVGMSGVRYGLTKDSCERATGLARREATQAADAAAHDLARALNLQKGEVVAVLEYPLRSTFFGDPYAGVDPCNSQGRGAGPVFSFHTEPETEVLVGLQVSYGLR